VNLEVNYSGCFHSILLELEVKVCLFLTGFTEFRGFVFWVLVESECFDSFLLILKFSSLFQLDSSNFQAFAF
jgi:hypothetical protein